MEQKDGESHIDIEFGKCYEGVLDGGVAGFSSLLLTLPAEPCQTAVPDRRSGIDRRVGDRRNSPREAVQS